MTTLAIANYIRLLTRTGTPTNWAFQNFHINASRSYDNITYAFAPFGITGRAAKKGGDRSQSTMILSNDLVSLNIAVEAVESRYLVEVKTVLLNSATFEPSNLLSQELWLASRLEVDLEKITLQLSSPMDAARAQFPRRQLSTILVGSLPATGNLVIS